LTPSVNFYNGKQRLLAGTLSANSSQTPIFRKALFLELIHLLADLIVFIGAAIAVRQWLRKRNLRIPLKLRGAAGIIGITYLGWMAVAVFAWGVITVNAVEQPRFFVSSALLTHLVASFAYVVVVVFGPAALVAPIMRRLDPKHWPAGKKQNSKRKGTSRKVISKGHRRPTEPMDPSYIRASELIGRFQPS
jgi:hypothetical protein